MRISGIVFALGFFLCATAGAQLDLDSAKKKCVDLGFKSGTEQYGKCVLQLSKVEGGRQAPQQMQPTVQASTLPQCAGDVISWNKCIGAQTFPNGNKYVGEWESGKYNGQGTFTWGDGAHYVGEWKNGLPNGQGTTTLPSGEQYVGEFRDNKRHGLGTSTSVIGEKYVGEWKDGKYNGQGTFTWGGGWKYVGEYKDGKRHGQGTEKRPDGSVFHSGLWAEGNPVK